MALKTSESTHSRRNTEYLAWEYWRVEVDLNLMVEFSQSITAQLAQVGVWDVR